METVLMVMVFSINSVTVNVGCPASYGPNHQCMEQRQERKLDKTYFQTFPDIETCKVAMKTIRAHVRNIKDQAVETSCLKE